MTSRHYHTRPVRHLILLVLLSLCNVALTALPKIDFNRMGSVGLAGSFAGFDFFSNSSFSFNPATSTLLSRSKDGSLVSVASTNTAGRIVTGCVVHDTFYFAGSFTSVGSTQAQNIASYNPATSSFASIGSGLDGSVDSLYCDSVAGNVWAGGAFHAPVSVSNSQSYKGAVAVYNVNTKVWSPAPFGGLTGAGGRVQSITSSPTASSLYFAGSFLTSFTSSGLLNGTNNPNVPFSVGATAFSSSLVPFPLSGPGTQINASPSSTQAEFSNINNVLCPGGNDGPGNTWFAQDGFVAKITIRTFQFSIASGVRMGNTFLDGRGTTAFSAISIPDNKPLTFSYIDPKTLVNQSCSSSCPLSTDPSVLYQDFLFGGAAELSLTGIEITLTEWVGASSGLHILQLLSSGAFASAVSAVNQPSCFATSASTASMSNGWAPEQATTSIAATTQPILFIDVPVGTSSAAGPSITWMPYVSAAGNYEINLLVPGCAALQECPLRTSVTVTVTPGGGLSPVSTQVPQTGEDDSTPGIYTGPLFPDGPEHQISITMRLSDNPTGTGQNGNYRMVADRVQLVLTSVNFTEPINNTINGSITAGLQRGFGFYEWPLNTQVNVDATTTLPNNTETPTDALSFAMFSALGNNTGADTSFIVNAVAVHSSGTVFLGGNFTLASGPANIVSFLGNSLVPLEGGGLNGPVLALGIAGDNLFVGGNFTDTSSGGSTGIQGVAEYNIQAKKWGPLSSGVNGPVTALNIVEGHVELAGSFTQPTFGFAAWDIASATWINTGGFIEGALTLVTNGTGSASEFLAGSVSASRQFGADGFAMISNSNTDEPEIRPLTVQLSSSPTPLTSKRSLRRSPWVSSVIPRLLSRQTPSQPVSLPALPVAIAPSVLTGAFWKNGSSETVIIAGNFSFSTGSSTSDAIAFYNPDQGTLIGTRGSQLNGTVRASYVLGNSLFVGGQFTMTGTSTNSLAIYHLDTQEWDTSFQSLQGNSVTVRSITSPSSQKNMIIVAGTFDSAGGLSCQGICQFDTSEKRWTQLGIGIKGEVSTVVYASNSQLLVAAGSITLMDGTAANVAAYSFSNQTWSAVGQGSQIPGPVTACEVDNGNSSSIFAAGSLPDGSQSFLTFWNGASWRPINSAFQTDSTISQLFMVPLQDTHPSNGIIEPDRMLLISGSLMSNSFGNVSSALFDGHDFFPYLVSSSSSGGPGFVSQFFRSIASFSFAQRHFFPVGVVILISIAISTGIVFLLLLIGILWTLASRRDHDSLTGQYTTPEYEDDNSLHRPSSLLAHINAATRDTIMGVAVEEAFAQAKGDDHGQSPASDDHHPYIRAQDTPIDAAPGVLHADGEDISRPTYVRYSFDGDGEGELPVSSGQHVVILDDRDPAWWYARDPNTQREGVIPASYLY